LHFYRKKCYSQLFIPLNNNVAASERNSPTPARRHQELVQFLGTRGQLTVDELAEHFGVSDDTIRRDLQILEQRKMILRTHGGAVSAGYLVHRQPSFSIRGQAHAVAKSRIGKVAAELISDGETLIVNGGSTTLAFATSLGLRRNLTIVTNNLAIPPVLPPEAIQEIYVLGGQYKVNLVSTIGAVGFRSGDISVDTAIIGISGMTARKGIATTVLEETSMLAEMISAAGRIIVLADASKFGRTAFGHFAPLSAIDIIVTDSPPPYDLAEALSKAGVEVVVAPA
jgi:DeoR family transcriptional regulator, fructose operon transcriptional repressor